MAKVLFRLPMVVVLLVLAVVWGPRASWDPLAMGGEMLVMVATMAMWR
jgi:hypothetical protein